MSIPDNMELSSSNAIDHDQILEKKQIESAKEDPKKFEVLYKKYHTSVFSFINKRIYDEHLSGDLTSEVFVKAMLNIKKFNYKGIPLSAWLYRIAINEINQYFRKRTKQRYITLETKHVENLMDELSIDNQDRTSVLLEEICQLREEEVLLIELRFFEEKPFAEIGQILNMTGNNAKVRLYRICAKLREKVILKILPS